ALSVEYGHGLGTHALAPFDHIGDGSERYRPRSSSWLYDEQAVGNISLLLCRTRKDQQSILVRCEIAYADFGRLGAELDRNDFGVLLSDGVPRCEKICERRTQNVRLAFQRRRAQAHEELVADSRKTLDVKAVRRFVETLPKEAADCGRTLQQVRDAIGCF